MRFAAARQHNKFDIGYVDGHIDETPAVTAIQRLDYENGVEIDWNHNNEDRVVVEMNEHEARHIYTQLTAIYG